jgi:FKBP-type peptidyl-prolyl cis-trans isomerase
MKKQLLIGALAGVLALPGFAQAAELDSLEQKVSYLLGLEAGGRLDFFEFKLDQSAFQQGMTDASKASERSLSEEAINETVQQLQVIGQQKQEAERQVLADANSKQGELFLVENGKKEGVLTTASGLQYKIITAGDGAEPKTTDTVKVHYRGTLIDGTEFDSSYSRNNPATFPLNGVIPGWTEGLQLLSPGGKAELYIPSELAYGPAGMNAVIGPNATLIFEVELLEVNPPQ